MNKLQYTAWKEGNEMTINYSEAEQMVIENEEMAAEFETWLKDRDKEAHEWDSDDLGEFFRSKGYITEV